MVRFFTSKHVFDHDWPIVTEAIWQRYPNPYAQHVHSVDVLSRHVDPVSGTLHSLRLILKSGILPSWLASIVRVGKAEALVIEESTVDVFEQRLCTVTRNINHRRMMVIEERATYERIDEASTLLTTDAVFRCQLNKYGDLFPLLQCHTNRIRFVNERMEAVCHSRFADNLNRSRLAMQWCLERLKKHRQQHAH